MKTKELLKHVVIFTICIFMCSLFLKTTVSAQTKDIDMGNGITASLSETGTLTITGSGAMPDQTSSSGSEEHDLYEIRNDIYNVVIGDQITRIGECSFSCLPNMQSVSIGNSVVEIGYCAFLCKPSIYKIVYSV